MQRRRGVCQIARLTGSIAAIVGTFLSIGTSLPASAQLAPVMGSHYAARASDTGFEGAVNSNGGYSASVPLDLPGARGGLPVPVQVVYGGSQVGAAGMGWDIPLSFAFRSTTTAHHRPAPGTLAAPTLLSVTLSGEHIDLVRNAADTAWVARRGNAQIEVRDPGNGTLVMYDGNGLTYTFSNQPATAASALDNGNMYLLTSVAGPGGNNVQLAYSFGAPTLPGGGNGLAINLASVSYNSSLSDATCFKNQVLLNYDTASTAPLSMSMLDATVLTRVQKLTSIDVTSKATCSATATSLRRYDFTYQTDPDTQRFQLHRVTVVGQLDTPERGVTLPVATYGYGAIADSARAVRYQKTQTLQPPLVASDAAGGTTFNFGIAYTEAQPSSELHGPNDTLVDLVTPQNFIDLNGDGRPNFFQLGDTTLLESFPGPNGTSVLSGNISRAGSQVSLQGLVHTANINFFGGQATTSTNETLRQFIDINGDGRLDVVETVLPDIDHWIVHLNTPDTNPGGIVWVDIKIPVTNMRAALNTTGAAFGRVPLGKTATVPKDYASCFLWRGDLAHGMTDPSYWLQVANFQCGDIPTDYLSRRTITEFELIDINGDGYPDFVYNASRVEVRDPTSTPPPVTPDLIHANTYSQIRPGDMVGSRDIKVLINTAGAHLADGVDLFAATPITLETGGANGCGISRWEPKLTGSVYSVDQICDFEDVNGDGIVDRVTSTVQNGSLVTTAALGTGDVNHPHAAGATISLPGPIGRTQNAGYTSSNPWFTVVCGGTGGTQTFTDTHRMSALRDINGDGIPDYISGEIVDGINVWNLYFGTGTGFSAAAGIVTGTQFDLSVERIACQNSVVGTPSGLYDIDGDGQPDVVTLNVSDGAPHWDVYQLMPQNQPFEFGHTSLGVPSAGRLISIDNGYGAVMRVDYRSAKEDNHGLHNVPYPEIVVGAEAVTDSNFNFFGAPTAYAYGNASLIFDAVYDDFVFPGYQRTVSLVTSNTPDTGDGIATITDAYAFAPFAIGIDATARFQRYLKVGRTSDVTTLSGLLGSDPWALLGTNIQTDSRAIGGTHYDWSTRLLTAGPAPAGNERCVDMVFPYDYTKSSQNALSGSDDVCTHHGFLFQQLVDSWRGDPGNSPIGFPSSTFNVRTRGQVTSVDDFGRVTSATNYNDFNPIAAFNRTDDDQCIATTYANPPHDSDRPRVLNAPAQRIVTDCGSTPKTLAQDQFEYDGLTTGTNFQKVSNGFVTSHTVTRVDENGSSLGDIREFDATYDAVGNLTSVTKTRGDGATQLASFSNFDTFNLVSDTATITATNADSTTVPTQTVLSTHDSLTLEPTSATDANGAVVRSTFDGFSRVTQAKVTPVGGTEGTISTTTYNGFAQGSSGRSIVQKTFTDGVSNVTSAGRVSTVYLDSLGREDRTEVQLGPDYQNKRLIVGQRSYDNLGRVRFVADPFPSDGNFSSTYGTTQLFNTDGTLRCAIRGSGSRTFTSVTDEVNEVYPTCSQRFFMNHQEFVESQDAASLLAGSAQAGVSHESAYSAIGRLLHSTTYGPNGGDNPLPIEASDFSYDSLGHLTTMRRFHDLVANGVENKTNPVQTTWHYDSLGWLTELDEQGNSAQSRIFDSWGEVTQTDWSDSATATSPTRDHRSITRYDALGRITHREEQLNGSVDADTVNDYTYDVPSTFVTRLTPTNVLGRLASASAPTLRVSYSYDGLGRVNGLGYDDRHGNPHVEKHAYHADGSPSTLDLLLHDTSFKDEQITYAYDSAGRVRSVKYNDGANQDLFTSPDSNDLDVFGRIRHAHYGLTVYTADFADAGRRLLNQVTFASPVGTSRQILFSGLNGLATQRPDPLGRERQRVEYADGLVDNPVITTTQYDALGRLNSATKVSTMNGTIDPPQGPPASLAAAAGVVSTTQSDRSFTFDPLGNVLTQADNLTAHSGSVTLSYQTTGSAPDRDRICSIGYGSNTPPATCNVSYDGAGNTVSESAPAGTRTFTYSPSGRVETIVNGSTSAAYKYDAFGAVHQLTVTTPTADARFDVYFGAYFKQRNEGGVPKFIRRIPVPGAVATRHGAGGPWTFEFAEDRGTRFVTDQTGAFVQDVNYQPFGEAASTGAQPGTTNYANEQWNGGDLLQALGVVQVGARIYDPVIGRFLSRDPLFDSGNMNPYAFAANDPINRFDPSGLETQPGDGGTGCTPGVNCPGDGGGGGGTPCDANGCGPGHTNNGPSGWQQFLCAWGFKNCTPPPKTSTYSSGGGSGKPAAQLPRYYHVDVINTAPGTFAADYRGLVEESFRPHGGGSGDQLVQGAGVIAKVGPVDRLKSKDPGINGYPKTIGSEYILVDLSDDVSRAKALELGPASVSGLLHDFATHPEALAITRIGGRQTLLSVDRLAAYLGKPSLDSELARQIANTIVVHEFGHANGLKDSKNDELLIMNSPIGSIPGSRWTLEQLNTLDAFILSKSY